MGCTNSKTKYTEDYSSHSDDDVYKKKKNNKNNPPYDVKPKEYGDDNNFLTEEQKKIVRATWQLIKEDKVAKGSKIFIKIFHKMPQVKDLFPVRELDDDSILNNALFKSHGLRFMMAVQTTVENLDALDLFLVPNLIKLGRKHVYITSNFTLYEQVFRESILEVFEEEMGRTTFSNATRESWSLLFSFITEKLLEGYNLEQLENNADKVEDVSNAAATSNEAVCPHSNGKAPCKQPDVNNATPSKCPQGHRPEQSANDDTKCQPSNGDAMPGNVDICVDGSSRTESDTVVSGQKCSTASNAGNYKHNPVPSITFSVADT